MEAAQRPEPDSLPASLEERAQLARALRDQALAAQTRGELLTAMLHAADALLLMPNDREYLDLVDDLADSCEDPLSLAPVSSGAIHVATAAVRARILMVKKDLRSALELIGDIIDVAPQVDYLDWARRWLVPHIVTDIGFDSLMRLVLAKAARLVVDVPVPPHPGDPRLNNVASAAAIFEAVRETFPDQAVLYWAEATARRRLGQTEQAIFVAQSGIQRVPDDAMLYSALMLALGDAKRPDEALAAARSAMQIEPADTAPIHDVAWCFVDAGRFDEATSLFGELLQREPDYPGAQSGFHYARYKAHNTPEDKAALLAAREREPGNRRLLELSEELDPIKYYYNFLPGPGDATAQGATHLARELSAIFRCCGAGASVGFALESRFLESPSVTIGVNVTVRALGGGGATLEVQPETVQEPDPRNNKAQIAYHLWEYQGTEPKRRYPDADHHVQAAIAQIAGQTFRQEIWAPAARQLALQYGPQWVHALFAIFTDPPLPPADSGFSGVVWTYRCQVATALVLSYLDPWGPEATSRSALYALAYGPTDWVTSAGLVAFGWRATEEPAIRQEAEAMFAWMRSQIPKQGFTCWENVLNLVWLGLGGHPPQLEADLKAWDEEYERIVHLKGAARLPTRRYGGLTLEEYAEFCVERDRIVQGSGLAGSAGMSGPPPADLVALCERFKLPMDPSMGCYPYVREWQEAITGSPKLSREFADLQRNVGLKQLGVKDEEIAALDEIRAGKMDMHARMAAAQEAQRLVNEGGGDPDPEVFPGQPVARLSDWVAIMKGMQTGDMEGALAAYGLDMMSYGSVATAWGAKIAADPVLTERFSRMMQ